MTSSPLLVSFRSAVRRWWSPRRGGAAWLGAAVVAWPLSAAAPTPPAVSLAADQTLVYQPDVFGHTVPDFSLAGYRHGGVPLPEAPVVVTLSPVAGQGDDSARIQEALDRVAQAPERAVDGVRGAVLLRRGAYRCTQSLRVAPGVTLRGEGPGRDGTVITADLKPRHAQDKPTLIQMRGERSPLVLAGTPLAVQDEAVPIGAKQVRVAGAAQALAAGDAVVVERRPNQEWIQAIKMDQIANLGEGGTQWKPAGYVLRWQARVVAVAGEQVTLDTPMICALERRYDRSSLQKIARDPRGRAAGVERLRLVSTYLAGQENRDEAHAWNAIGIADLVDSWVREVTALHFAYACVTTSKSVARVTVQDCALLDPVSQITGGRRYSFVGGGQFVLFQRCYARHGRHDFVTGSIDAGPTVFLDCLAEQTHGDAGPHHRWSSGQLYDNVQAGQLHVQDRGKSGTGHGWAGNAQVFWNCAAPSLLLQRAWIPSAQNWAIGCVGAKGRPALTGRPEGWWESLGQPVAPRSLYLAQLRARLAAAGGEADAALAAVTTPEQRAGRIWAYLKKHYETER